MPVRKPGNLITAVTAVATAAFVFAISTPASTVPAPVATSRANASPPTRQVHTRPAARRGTRRLRATASAEVAATPPIASLHLRATPQGLQAVVENRIDGPVQVALSQTGPGQAPMDPPLPVRAVIEAHARRVLSTLVPGDGGDPQLVLDAVPGDPASLPADVDYLLPLRGTALRIDQHFGGSLSHDDDENRFAIDFAVPVGSVVIAARDGVVMQAEWRFTQSGSDAQRDVERANLVRVLHDDGSMAVYGHLQADGVFVRGGQHVRAGQQIALSGNTGFSTGPHLHFAVQVNRGMHLESIRFRMRGPAGPMRLQGNL